MIGEKWGWRQINDKVLSVTSSVLAYKKID